MSLVDSVVDGASDLSRRAAEVVLQIQPSVSLTMSELTQRQREDMQFLARQTYLQGRVDALKDFRDRRVKL